MKTCPPCTGSCVQGRDCPGAPLDGIPTIIIGCVLGILLALLGVGLVLVS